MPERLDASFLSLLSLFYLLCLFIVAYLGDRAPKAWLERVKPWVIGLSLTIYCTAWSFYGTTSQAVYNGWLFPPTFIGAFVTLVLAAPLVRRIIRISKAENSTSIADFLGSRYGGSQWLSIAVTAISVIALLPYISLQLKAISGSFITLTGSGLSGGASPWQDAAFYTALALALFTILFGTRHIDRKEHHDGLMLAIAFESIIKLAVFILLAVFVCFVYFDNPWHLWQQVQSDGYVQQIIASRRDDQGFSAALVLGAAAIICLPRQFHALVVESRSEDDLKPAARVLWLYLAVFGLAILPIAYGGLILLQGQSLSPEKFALLLPLQHDQQSLATLVYLGGLSAGSSMVIVACVAVSIMICNEIVMPALMRSGALARQSDLSGSLRIIRRLAIIGLLSLAYGYYRWLGSNEALGSIGLLSMTLVAQFAPALIAALFWQKRRAKAALAGLLLGFAIWAYTLLLPAFGLAGWVDSQFIDQGPWGIEWLRPEQLFGFSKLSSISNGVLWSLLGNSILFVLLSLWYVRQQEGALPERVISREQLLQLAGSFLGQEQAQLALDQFTTKQGDQNIGEHKNDLASSALIDYVEKLLAGVIGSVSARHIIQYASAHQHTTLHSDLELLQETSQIFQFSRSTLQASIDSISQGISVVDANKQLVAWNRRYLELFDYPQQLIHVGRPVADLVRYNAQRGHCGPGSVQSHIDKRLAHLNARQPYVFERHRGDNTVLEIRGTPLPDGGYVTTYTDISDYRRALTELTEHKSSLEQKVATRTAELSHSNELLAQANHSKTRFLAAAGHDLAQPLNAARLFTEALLQKNSGDGQDSETLNRIAHSIQSAEHLIAELLNIAKLDAGAIVAERKVFSCNDILHSLNNDFHLSAEQKGLQLRCRPSDEIINSDPKLLLRILQNLVANAIRYTQSGVVLIAARRRGKYMCFEVWDTGIGIPTDSGDDIFGEFKRLNTQGDEGSGLGLATVKRLCELLEHPVSYQSLPGQGSVFRVMVPRAEQSQIPTLAITPAAPTQANSHSSTDILLIENDGNIVAAMGALFEQWGIKLRHGDSIENICKGPQPHIILADYHLDNNENGLQWLRQLQQHWGRKLTAIIISADRTDEVKRQAQSNGYYYLKKPVKPAALRALIDKLSRSL